MSDPGVVPDSSSPPAAVETTLGSWGARGKATMRRFQRLFARHLQPLQRFARGRLPGWARGPSDTDDLVQDALLQTLKRLDTFESRHPGALQAYLRQAVMNRLRDELRRHARGPSRVDLDDAALSERSWLEETVGLETITAYEEALRQLKPEEREAVIGRVELGLTYDELALALEKLTADAARKAAQRALVHLAQEMERER